MSPHNTLRKAFRAAKLRIAHVNNDYAEMDIAIVKATGRVMAPPKEKHIRKIIIATTVVPRSDIVYCIQALSRRLAKTHNWTVAMKTLIVLHQILREGDPTFREELWKFSRKEHILELSHFKDDSSPKAWDCSAAVRTYALFLEQRLECFSILKYDVEFARIPSSGKGQGKGFSRTRYLNSVELLEQLPVLQQLLHRLIGCQPEGAAASSCVIKAALTMLFLESFNIYCAINDGIINLVDKFFEMSKHEAMKALDIYKRAGEQAGNLSDFYEVCKGLPLTRNFQFPILREPPQSFLTTMEEYIREAPRVVPIPLEISESSPTKRMLTDEEAASSSQEAHLHEENEISPSLDILLAASRIDVPPNATQPSVHIDFGDLLDLSIDMPNASMNKDITSLPLKINDGTSESHSDRTNVFDPIEWEPPLLTTPISNFPSVTETERQLADGLNLLTLDSLPKGEYSASLRPVYEMPAENLIDLHQEFALSKNITPTTIIPITASPQLQNPFGPLTQPQPVSPSNPFGEAGVTQLKSVSGLNPAHQHLIHPQVSNPSMENTSISNHFTAGW